MWLRERELISYKPVEMLDDFLSIYRFLDGLLQFLYRFFDNFFFTKLYLLYYTKLNFEVKEKG